MVLWWLYLNPYQPQCQTFPFFHIIFAWLNSSFTPHSDDVLHHSSHIFIYIYTSQCERSTKISLFILDNDDAVDVIQNHILAFTHTSLNVIFIGMFTTIPPPPLETESERNCKNGVPTTDIQNYKARKLWFHEERKGFCATFNTHTQITSHTINLMEWSFSSFHH